MAAGLGDTVEGTYQDVILRKPTNCPTPYLCVLDEYGYYAVKGFAVVPAQARSLGFSVVFAGQDLPAYQKASKEEAASIGANTNIKICMKLEDPTDTWEFFMKSAGDAYVTAVESFNSQNPGLTGSYQDSKSAKAEKRARINLLDLKEQGVGEAHVFFKSNIIRANLFFMDPGPAKEMRLNVMMKVEIPKDEVLYTLVKSIEDFEQLIQTSGIPNIKVEKDEQLESILESQRSQRSMLDPIDKGLNVLFHLHKIMLEKSEQEVVQEETGDIDQALIENAKEIAKIDEEEPDKTSKEESENITRGAVTGSIDILMRIHLSKDEKRLIGVNENLDLYELPLVNQSKLNSTALYMMRMLGKKKDEASKEVSDTIALIKSKTTYRSRQVLDVEGLTGRINRLAKLISG